MAPDNAALTAPVYAATGNLGDAPVRIARRVTVHEVSSAPLLCFGLPDAAAAAAGGQSAGPQAACAAKAAAPAGSSTPGRLSLAR
jgi:hypothetical protein